MVLVKSGGTPVRSTALSALGSVSVTSTTPTLASGQTSVLKVPASGSKRMGVIYLHGGFSTEAEMTDGSAADLATTALAAARFPVIGGNVGGSLWGNDTTRTYIDELVTYLTSTVGADMAYGVAIIGTSMGAWNGLSWISTHLSSTACFVGLAPASDGDQLQGTVLGTSAGPAFPGINEAYGGNAASDVGWEAAKATHDPTLLAAAGAFAGLRYKAWYGTADTTVLPATVTTIASSIGGTASLVRSVGATHATLLAGVQPAQVVNYIAQSYPPVATATPVVDS